MCLLSHSKGVFCTLGWTKLYCVAEDGLEPLILLPSPKAGLTYQETSL